MSGRGWTCSEEAGIKVTARVWVGSRGRVWGRVRLG